MYFYFGSYIGNQHMNKSTDILLMLVSAFFSGFSVGLSETANKKGRTFLQFASEVLIHGVSGSILGALSTIYVDDIVIVCAIAAIGGMFGQQLIKAITTRFLKKYLPTKGDEKNDDKDCF